MLGREPINLSREGDVSGRKEGRKVRFMSWEVISLVRGSGRIGGELSVKEGEGEWKEGRHVVCQGRR